MISDSAALVIFAISSALKLGQQIRQACVDAAKGRPLVLPLPNFFSQPDVVSAANYFAGPGAAHVTPDSQLSRLLQKRKSPGQVLTPGEEEHLLGYHVEFFNLDLVRAGKIGRAADGSTLHALEYTALITVRQWQRGAEPHPTTLQRLAGTFIEIGVNYFANVPGALSKDSSQGKALAGFFQGMSEIRFSEEELGEIPGRLFVAALETISVHGELLSADAKVQELVRVVTASLSSDVACRIAQAGDADLVRKEHIGDWAELVFRSVLSSAGGLVLANPKRFLGLETEGRATLVSCVGESVLGLVLDNADLHVDRLFSRQGVETVVKSALAVVGEHPEILVQSNNAGLRKLLSSIAAELSTFDTLFTPDLLPELTSLILDRTGDNLALLWPDLAHKPHEHLLLTAAGTTLAILSRKPGDNQKWKLRFGRADVLAVTDAVFAEVAANPAWLLKETGQLNDNLKTALEAALAVVRTHADNRLAPATVVEVLCAVVHRTGQRKEFLDRLPDGCALAGQPLIAAALDAVFRTVFDGNLEARAAWQVVRSEAVAALVGIGLARLAKVRLDAEKVAFFTDFIKQRIDMLAAGEPLDLTAFERDMHLALSA
jgi:hypothetical protein